MPTSTPQFSTADLLKAAEMAQIDPATIPGNANPWNWQDPRSFAWQSAFRMLNPVLAQEAELSYGPPLSLALQAAIDGISKMNGDLLKELAVKRPHQAQQMKQASIDEAISRIEEAREAERAHRAEATPSAEQIQWQSMASKQAAAAHLRSLNGIPDASDA